MILGIDASRAVGQRTGVGRDLQHLLAAWASQPLPFESVRVFAPSTIGDLPADNRFHLELLPSRGSGIWWQLAKLKRAAEGVDVLFAPYTLPPGYEGRSVVNNLGIYEGKFAFRGWRARAHSRHMAWSARHATQVIANSESTKNDLVRFYRVPAERILVIWPGVAEHFRPLRAGEEADLAVAAEQCLGAAAPYFLFVGKLSVRRNIPALLDAFRAVRARHPEYRLLLVGPNIDGIPLDAMLAERDLGLSVRHLEFVDHDLLALLYRGAHAFVLPTEHEGFSFTIPEALASGCAVVTVDHAALREGDLESATLALPRPDPELLAAALGRMIEDDRLRSELRQRGPRAARSLSWHATARKTMEALEQVGRVA